MGLVKEGVTINQLQCVDLNLDGQTDVFLTAGGNLVGMQAGTDEFSFWEAFSILSTNPVADVGKAAFTDVNADGLLDIALPLDREGLTQDQFLLLTRVTP